MMKNRLILTVLILSGLTAASQTVSEIADRLAATECVNATIRYSVTLPQNDDDIIYTINATAYTPPVADRLSPCDYVIRWSLPTPSGVSEGFSAYFDGHHYRFRDQRLQEYHLTWDSIPFLLGGGKDGIQTRAQFTELLPAFMARELKATLADSTYIYSKPQNISYNGRDAVRLKMERVISGMTAMERTYIFDATTMLPLRIDTESNPGSITEQSILADYTFAPEPDCPILTEEKLIEAFPDYFGKYRQSNFRIENMPGTQLPAFSLRRTDGTRFTRSHTDPLPSPTVIAFLEPGTGFSDRTVEAVRKGVEGLPYQAMVIWAFPGNNADEIEEIIPELRPGEQILTGAKNLARDCGISAMPVVMTVDRSGMVKKVIIGFNNELADVVLQEMALLN